MSAREQNRFNMLVVKTLGELKSRIDDCFANISAGGAGCVAGKDCVTDGDAHDHTGGAGAQIAWSTLSGRRLFLPLGVYREVSPMTLTNSDPYSATIDRTLTFIRWSQSFYVSTTNDGSNYWIFELLKFDATVINSINTSGSAADAFVQISDTTFLAASIGVADVGLYIHCTKFGNPGPLYFFGPMLEVEL